MPGHPKLNPCSIRVSSVAKQSCGRLSVVRTVGRLAGGFILVAALLVVILMIFEEAFIFFPAQYPEGDWQPEGITVEDAWFEADDGTRIHGWYVPHENPRATVLLCHGNAGNLSHRTPALGVLHDRVGVSVLIFDYRGYGRSEGEPNEAGILADARAAREWLAQREGIEETEIVLLGRSLGGAVAVDLARDGAKALVLESTFTSVPDMAARLYPFLPVRKMMRTRLDSLGKIGAHHGPLLQSHGDADTIVPLELGRRLFDAANEPKQFIVLPGLDHNDPQPRQYYDQLIRFLESVQ